VKLKTTIRFRASCKRLASLSLLALLLPLVPVGLALADEPRVEPPNIMREASSGTQGNFKLFDLSKDPYEENDLAQKMPERVMLLSKRLKEVEASCLRSRDGGDYSY